MFKQYCCIVLKLRSVCAKMDVYLSKEQWTFISCIGLKIKHVRMQVHLRAKLSTVISSKYDLECLLWNSTLRAEWKQWKYDCTSEILEGKRGVVTKNFSEPYSFELFFTILVCRTCPYICVWLLSFSYVPPIQM